MTISKSIIEYINKLISIFKKTPSRDSSLENNRQYGKWIESKYIDHTK